MHCNGSSKKSFHLLIAGTIVMMVISAFKTSQEFSGSIANLSSVLRLNGSILYPRSKYFSPPLPAARWNATSVPTIFNETITTHINVSMATSNSPDSYIVNFSAPSRPPSCSPAMNIAYIKTLKTGSTSVQTIINRFGFFHNLSFILNRNSSKNGHFYHLPFTDKTAETHLLPPICVAAKDYPNYRNYNMMAVHVRYQREAMNRYFAPGTHYLSIIRDPGMQWESAFNHFKFHDAILLKPNSNAIDNSTLGTALIKNASFVNGSIAFQGCSEKLRNASMIKESSSTFKESNCSIPELIEEFMNHPDIYRERLQYMKWENEMGRRWAYARNNQIYDLGLEPEYHDNVTAVNEWIEKLQREFSLVLINEYFDESLLVMRKLFCWSFMDIAYIAKNVRINVGGVGIADDLRDKIRKWNSADTLLYASLNRTLWRRISDYGPGFDHDLEYFKNLLETVLHNCTKETETKLWDPEHLFGHYEREPRNNATLFCRTMAERKGDLHKRVYCRQDINRTANACKEPTKKAKYHSKPKVIHHKPNVPIQQKHMNTISKYTGSSVKKLRHRLTGHVKIVKQENKIASTALA